MIRAYILAGGFGTRLSHIVKDVPKPMAPVHQIPFLEFQIRFLINQGIEDFILLTGYLSGQIESYFGDGSKFGVSINYSVETSPLGTGGAVLQAMNQYPLPDNHSSVALILNGDTYFDINLKEFIRFHKNENRLLSIALKYKNNISRYGAVKLEQSQITGFIEKDPSLEDGLINGGIYLLAPQALSYFPDTRTFSFENTVIPELLKQRKISGLPFGNHFIDIGIPEDYEYAQNHLHKWFNKEKIKAVFLDRDGIINEDTGHTHRISDFRLIEGVVPFLQKLTGMGFHFFILTNQAGIGKKIFLEEDYHQFQNHLIKTLNDQNIHITHTYYCPYHPEAADEKYRKNSYLRKPSPGMALTAAEDYHIDLSRSFIIGDKLSDRLDLPYLKTYILKNSLYPLKKEDQTPDCFDSFEEILTEIQNEIEKSTE